MYKSVFQNQQFPVNAVSFEQSFAWKLDGLYENNVGTKPGYWRPKDLADLYLMIKYPREPLDIELTLPLAILV